MVEGARVKIKTGRIIGSRGKRGFVAEVKEGKFPYLVYGAYGIQHWFKEDELEFIGMPIIDLDSLFLEYDKASPKRRAKMISETYDKVVRLLETQKQYTLSVYVKNADHIDTEAYDIALDSSIVVDYE